MIINKLKTKLNLPFVLFFIIVYPLYQIGNFLYSHILHRGYNQNMAYIFGLILIVGVTIYSFGFGIGDFDISSLNPGNLARYFKFDISNPLDRLRQGDIGVKLPQTQEQKLITNVKDDYDTLAEFIKSAQAFIDSSSGAPEDLKASAIDSLGLIENTKENLETLDKLNSTTEDLASSIIRKTSDLISGEKDSNPVGIPDNCQLVCQEE